jgi:hypothetical protein
MVGAFSLSCHAVRAHVEAWPKFAMTSETLRVGTPPPGLSERASSDLAALPLPRPTSPFDRRLVPFAAARLSELPWVKSVDAVRLKAEGGLSFSMTTRLPVARVGGQVVTGDGVTIAARYAGEPERLPRLVGCSGTPSQLALDAVVSVLDDLGPFADRVRDVDVSGLVGEDALASEVVLILDGGLRVEWGRPSCSKRPNLAGATKRAALVEFLERGPELATVAVVSVRWDETSYVLKPATELAANQ